MVRSVLSARLISLALVSITGIAVAHPRESVAQTHSGATAVPAAVVLRPGDRVRLKVWREPDLSGDFDVDERGVVVFPKVGRTDVRNLSADSLQALLIAFYAQSLRSPSVEVTVLRRVNVLGSVRNPGVYYVDPVSTVADVLAMAGGATPDGKQNEFELLRNGERIPGDLSVSTRLADSPLQSGDQLRVPERSWISRNATVVAAGITAFALIFTATLVH